MKKIKIKILFIATLLFSGHLNADTITWDLTSFDAGLGSSFSLDVVGLGFASNVDGGGVDISFDSSVLNVLSVTIDEVVWDFGASGIDTGTIDNGAGTVDGIMVNAMSAVTGDFIVATVQFQTVGAALSSSGLTLTELFTNPWASGGSAINPIFLDGNVSVVPVPGAVWLFGSGLIALMSFARRKRKV